MRPIKSFLVTIVLFISANLVAQNKPNIILIVADDLGYGDLSCYGQKQFTTPNIDALAKDGIKFTNFYAGATVCAPSRAALLTGKHNGHNTVRGNQPFPQQLGNESTIASMLKTNGYTTGLIGKWGIGHPQPIGDPERCGFMYSYGYLNMWHAHNFYPEFLYENGVKVSLKNKLLPKEKWSNNSWVGSENNAPEGYGEAAEKIDFVPQLMQEKALSFIEMNKNKPFFLFFTPTIPHANNEMKKNGMEVPDYGKFANKNWPDVEKGFAQSITILDEIVGSIRKKVTDLGIANNTIIIFTSDNGPHNEGGHSAAFFNSSGQLRGTKRDLYDGGIKVPMIAYWPTVIPALTTNNLPFAQYDFLATFASIAAIKKVPKTDGISILPSLTNNIAKQLQHAYLYWEFYESGGRQAVLQYPYKLIKLNTTTFSQNGAIELYNIQADPQEKNNIAPAEKSKVNQLLQLLQQAHTPKKEMSLFVPKPGQAGKT